MDTQCILLYVYNKLCMSHFVATSYDFDESIQIVRFSPRQSIATVYIKIYNDNRVETTEAFQVDILLSKILYLRGFRLGSPSKAKVYIKDGTYANL